MSTGWNALSTWLIRTVFDADAARNTRKLRRGAPADVAVRSDVAYGSGADELLDLYLPAAEAPESGFPVIVWTHGGGWIAGDKSHYAGYFRRLASWGYAVVSVGYTLAPAAAYPTALRQIDAAHGYLIAHAAELGIDPDRFVLGGDSAGAQLTAELAELISGDGPGDDPSATPGAALDGHAGEPSAAPLEGTPALPASALRGVVLHCGLYDLPPVLEASGGVGGWAMRRILSDYTGAADPAASPVLDAMSVRGRLTADFPPALVTGGNGDALTGLQSRPLAERLEELGVDVTTVFFEDGHRPKAPHEFQFDLGKEAGTRALDETRTFLARTLAVGGEAGSAVSGSASRSDSQTG